MPLIPYVVEKSGREERAMDIYSRLLRDRIIDIVFTFLTTWLGASVFLETNLPPPLNYTSPFLPLTLRRR